MSVYVLKLKNDKWYVGYSANVTYRINTHFGKNNHNRSDRGAAWVSLHNPEVVTDILDGDKQIQKAMTLYCMKKFGVDNVRGYCWSQRVMHPKTVVKLKQLLGQRP